MFGYYLDFTIDYLCFGEKSCDLTLGNSKSWYADIKSHVESLSGSLMQRTHAASKRV